MKKFRSVVVVGFILLVVMIGTLLPVTLWFRLEIIGEVPIDSSNDYYESVAQYTTWWGKPINAKEFWKDRTIWCDLEAKKAAQRHGRWYPPIPGEDSKHLVFSNKGYGLTSGGPDSGPFVTRYETERERYFWDDFFKTHPKPPFDLEWKQMEIASDVYFWNHINERKNQIGAELDSTNHADMIDQLSTNKTVHIGENSRREILQFNYPEEAFTDEALFWCRVMAARNPRGQISRMFAPRTYADIDLKLVTEPLTMEQKKAANAWKVAYLQRLRREKTDESYINAYLKAWQLSPIDVFPETKFDSQ